jgi:hypothetical protein
MCSFIVVHERSITKCDLINNIIKTILPRSIGLFFSKFRNSWHCSDVRSFFPHNFVVLQFSKKIFCKYVSLKTDGLFSPIRLFCHKYIETKRKSAKSDIVINSYI